MDDYRLVVQHSENISSVYIHIDKLSDKIAADAPAESGYVNVDIPVSAGEILGNYSGTLDYNVVDLSVTLTGFVLPKSYTREEWKIHWIIRIVIRLCISHVCREANLHCKFGLLLCLDRIALYGKRQNMRNLVVWYGACHEEKSE